MVFALPSFPSASAGLKHRPLISDIAETKYYYIYFTHVVEAARVGVRRRIERVPLPYNKTRECKRRATSTNIHVKRLKKTTPARSRKFEKCRASRN